MEEKKMTVKDITALKGKRKVTMLTAYDYPIAQLEDRAGIDMILVGDSVANVVLGLKSTTEVGMAEMLHHAKAVRRGVSRALVVGDMPFGSVQGATAQVLRDARRFAGEAGCDAVKLEWFDGCLEAAAAIVAAGIPVVGHIGLTPQTADKLGGFKVQGKDAERARELMRQAAAFEKSGCFALVLECVPDRLAGMITEERSLITIGIGAGPHCDGQVLVINDMIGLFDRYTPKFVKKFADLSPLILKAVGEYRDAVANGSYPAKEHCFTIKEEELRKLKP